MNMKNLYSYFTKKLLLILLVSFALFTTAQAQVPQFYNFNAAGGTNVFPLGSTTNNKVQWIYPPNVFNSMGSLGGTPAYPGNITKVYFRLGNSNQPTFTDFTISLAQNVGTQGAWASSTYNIGMQQVFAQNTYNMTGAVSGQWWGVTLQTPFLYDPTQSLVFEMKQAGYTNGGMQVEQISNAFSGGRIWGGLTATVGAGNDANAVDFGFDLIPATPCTGQPVAGSITPVNPTVCAGQSINMGLAGTTLAGNMIYNWQSAPTAAGPWTTVGNTLGYSTPSLTATTYYRFIITCTPSGLSDTTATNIITVAPPSYAALPYTQDFESWANYCNVNDAPSDFHWTGSPLTGNDSWRRNDQGGSAAWTIPANGMYNPASSSGQYSARYHSYYGAGTGNLDMYVNCNSATGNKTLAFDYINISGNDFLQIEFSPNGGLTFIPLVSFNNSTTWQTQYVTIPSNSATTIIRFKASGGTNFTAASDIGLDNVKLLAPCTGAVVAGTIDSVTPCANQPFNLNLTGSTQAGGLTYNWESATSLAGPWTNFATTAGPTVSTTIPAARYIRCIVTCPASNQSDTTVVRFVNVGSFWVCYCQSMATVVNFENIGNVLIKDALFNTILNNGDTLPLVNNSSSVNVYSNFTALTPTTLYKDSSYNLRVSAIANDAFFSTGYCAAYVDFNRDGVYDPINERVLSSPITTANNQSTAGIFPVPPNAVFGLTGMRIVFSVFGSATTISPCGSYTYGETEDYVVNIAPSPCVSPPNAGTAYATDTATCPGTAVIVSNTTYDKIYANLNSSWQLSTDGINYNDIPGGNMDSIIVNPTVNSWYRLRVTCNGNSTSYSNVQKVSMLPPTSCFGLSATTGTINDTSDIGALVISTPQPTNINLYTYSSGGPHLLNPAANRFYTNYTPTGIIDLYADSTYKLSIYHIMRTATHGDAKVTVFIDYNNNFNFDLPNELVYSGIADINNYFLNAEIRTPVAPALNVPLAMRIVLNNDIGPNGPSDTGYGTYVSGETEDFFVRFAPIVISTNVEDFNDLTQIGLYPNPTNGLVYIGFKATKTLDVTIDVLSVTGAKVMTKKVENVSGNYNSTMDLSGLASGVYMMKFTTDKGDFVKRITVE